MDKPLGVCYVERHGQQRCEGAPATIDVRGLTRRFGQFVAVDGVSFDVARGEIFGFLGSNGAGKSTTIRMLCGLLKPTAGTAIVGGIDVTRDPEGVKRRIGYMSQRFSLYELLTVEQNIRFFGGVYGLDDAKLAERRRFVIEMAGLAGREHTLARDLAGGWRQRLALGCAILHEPAILFLDEPTGGVDPLSRRQFWRLIDALSSDGVTILVTTHYLDEAERCHRVALIHAGRLATIGTTSEVKQVFAGRPILEIRASNSVAAMRLLDGFGEVEKTSLFGTAVHAVLRDARTTADDIRRKLHAAGVDVEAIEVVPPSLEDVFLDVVDRASSPTEGLRPSDSPTRSLAGPLDSPLRSRGSVAGAPSLRSRLKALAVYGKELRQIRRDRRTLMTIVFVPAFFLLLYGYALNWDIKHIGLAVQDRDGTAQSRALISAFVNSGYFDRVADVRSTAEIDRVLNLNLARAVLVIPAGFGRDLVERRSPSVQFLVDGDNANTATTVMGYAGNIVRSAGASLVPPAAVVAPPIFVEPRIWYNPELRSTLFLVPGLIAYILMITAVISTALSIVREKESGTMEQVRMAPIDTFSFVVGKSIPYFFISLASATLIIFAAMLLFGLPMRGNWLALLLALSLFIAGALGTGLLISTVAETQQVAFQAALLTSFLPTLMLSGFIFPISSMPAALQVITYIVPARYFLVALRGIVLKGSPISVLWPQMLALSIYALVMLTLASVRLAREKR